MSLIINHNLMAENTGRHLGANYKQLSTSLRRLSSGLRINSAADDAAGLAIREMMRADIAAMKQGIRNASDAISLIQTAEGAMAVIDEKLTRMKELAEQAATGTYTTAQRELINSEYQAMALEIDRIANATNFNGIKLLDGSLAQAHGGRGLKIHFGAGDSPAEDYYFIKTGDARATAATGLRVGGDARNDVWAQGGAAGLFGAGQGCCAGGFTSLTGPAGFKDGQSFSFGYNWDWQAQNDPEYNNGDNLLTGKYLAGRYTVNSAESLQDLVNKVNAGAQSRVGVSLNAAGGRFIDSGGSIGVCVGDEAYIWGDKGAAEGGPTLVPQFKFTYSATGLYANAEKTLYTDNAGLAASLGFTPLAFSAVTETAPDAVAAAADLNRQIADFNANASRVIVSAQNAVSAANTTGLYLEALKYLVLTSASVAPEPLKPSDMWMDDWSFMGIISAYNVLDLSAVVHWAIDIGYIGKVFADLWIYNIFPGVSGLYATNSAIGEIFFSPNWPFGGELWHGSRISATVVSGDTYATLLAKFTSQTDVIYFSNPANNFSKTVDIQPRYLGGYDSIIGKPYGATRWGGNPPPYEGIWGSAGTGIWTTRASVASALMLPDLGAGTYAMGDSLFDVVAAINSALARKHFSQVIYSAHGVPGLNATEFWTDGVIWTTEAALGDALDYDHVMLNLEYDQRIDGIMTQLTAFLDGANIKIASTLGASLGSATGPTDDSIGFVERKIYGFVQTTKAVTMVGSTGASFNAYALASAINHNSASKFWAMLDSKDSGKLYIFSKEGGDNNDLTACDVYGLDEVSRAARSKFINFENVATGAITSGGAAFTLGTTGAEAWGVLKPVLTRQVLGGQVWNLSLNGRDVGYRRDLWIAAARELLLPGLNSTGYDNIIKGLDRYSFVEVRDAADAPWAGAEIRTQESAQKALEAINEAINSKDKVRATLGAYQNRLENTISNLEIQAENLQVSESRISDADVAKEVTQLTRNSVLVQAALGMLAQANSLSNLALSLIGR